MSRVVVGVVFGGFFGGESGGVGGAEVGSVTAEHGSPLLSGVVEIFGDEVRGIGFAPAGHGDIGRRRAGVFAKHQVGGTGCFALGSVDGRGICELDIMYRIRGGNLTCAGRPT